MEQREKMSRAILETAAQRGLDKSTCPSEVARMLFPVDWCSHMAEVREVAIGLQRQGRVLLTQKVKPVDIQRFKGPVRIRIVKG